MGRPVFGMYNFEFWGGRELRTAHGLRGAGHICAACCWPYMDGIRACPALDDVGHENGASLAWRKFRGPNHIASLPEPTMR